MPQSLPLYATARQEAGVATSPRPRGRATSRCCTCCRRTLRQFSVSEAAAAAAAARRKLPQLPTPASASHLLQLQLQLQRPAPAAIDDDDDDDPVLVVGGHTHFFCSFFWRTGSLALGSFGAHFTFCDGCSNRCPLSVAINYATRSRRALKMKVRSAKSFPKKKKNIQATNPVPKTQQNPLRILQCVWAHCTPLSLSLSPVWRVLESENIVAKSSLSSNANRRHRRLIKTLLYDLVLGREVRTLKSQTLPVSSSRWPLVYG